MLAQRAAGSHMAGTWEFPGGKIDPGESAERALRRELREELGITAGAVEPLISVPWHYPEKSIVLHAFRVLDFHGEPQAREHAALRWIDPADALELKMPPPDRPIVNALRLPHYYAITPEPHGDDGAFLAALRRLVSTAGPTDEDGADATASTAKVAQLRVKTLAGDRFTRLVATARDIARSAGTTLLLNGHLQLARDLRLDGVHLPAAELMRLDARPLDRNRWVGASCHNAAELGHAAAIDVDFAVLGPVRPTPSHPDAPVLGWRRFAELVAAAPFPVFALGGLGPSDLADARSAGAHGIAGISAFWPKN